MFTSGSRKRKHRPSKKRTRHTAQISTEYTSDPENGTTGNSGNYQPPDPSLFIQAYEADLVRGPQAWDAARSLEVVLVEDGNIKVGDGLIKGNDGPGPELAEGIGTTEDTFVIGNKLKGKEEGAEAEREGRGKGRKGINEDVWMDRYDARLLLDTLPKTVSESPSSPGELSDSGWTDLPSDAEDTFFLAPAEQESYHAQKRRRLLDSARQARLQALQDESPEDAGDDLNGWDSDEEASEDQLNLMKRTARHLATSDNPAQLEMRILANFGGDERFAFLRGRWGAVWRAVREEVKRGKEREDREKEGRTGLGLGAYGDSDDDEEDGEGEEGEGGEGEGGEGEEVEGMKSGSAPTDKVDQDRAQRDVDAAQDQEAIKAARRAKAREWAEKRRSAKASNSLEADGDADE